MYLYIQAPIFATNCAANIIMYDITVMDQYTPAITTVPANMSSVEISQFTDNGTTIVANREYTITVSAISDQRTSYPSDPVTISKYSCRNLCTNVTTYVHICLHKNLFCMHVYIVYTYIRTYIHNCPIHKLLIRMFKIIRYTYVCTYELID